MEVNEVQEQMKAVQRMQEYIEEHLEEEITLANLSEVSLFSSWHSYRLFKNYLGMTPAEYIRRLRLSHSAMRLKKEQCLVIDAAYDCGFESVDGYTRAFYKEFGCNPGEYVKDPVPIGLFIPYGVKFRELRKDIVDMENLQSVFVQVICKPERKVIIKRGIKAEDYFDYCAEVNCEVWGILMSMDSLCGEPVCLWLPEEYKKPGTSTYVQGESFREEDYSQAILSVQYSLNHYDLSVIGYEWDDSNPRIQLEPRGERGYIEMRAIQKRGIK